MARVSNGELIRLAKSVAKLKKLKPGNVAGEVGCALVTDKGNVYLGVNIDAVCGIGFCAEHTAIAAMLTGGERKIKRIVAATKKSVIPPCGRCREFMNQLHPDSLNSTEVVLGKNKTVKLRKLLPRPWN